MKKPALYEPKSERMQALAGARLASFGSRAVALMIDFLLAGALFLGFFIVLIFAIKRIPALQNWQANRHIHIELNFFENWYSLIYLALFFGLTLYWGHGQTLGKRLMRIRVLSLQHEHLSLWHSMERALGYGASAAELGFGFIQYFIYPNHQTLHDRIAETIVVREKGRGGLAGNPTGQCQ